MFQTGNIGLLITLNPKILKTFLVKSTLNLKALQMQLQSHNYAN